MFLLFFIVAVFAEDKVLRMGYRTTPKAPLIAKAPDNSGLYLDL